jgi:hypothetical protein
MKYRVSFYRKSEIVAGRAPRYMVDIEAKSVEDAQAIVIKKGDDDLVVRSGYKPVTSGSFLVRLIHGQQATTPWTSAQKELLQALNEADWLELKPPYKQATARSLQKRGAVEIQDLTSVAPIPEKISYVFITPEDRNKWYSSHKSEQPDRLCHDCGKNEVDRYKRICDECLKKRSVKPCALCKEDIQIPNRHRYCDKCHPKRKETQEKFHREHRATRNTIVRIRKQLQWAKNLLKTTTPLTCKFAYRYQGLRRPHIERGDKKDRFAQRRRRCRTCLQKFIDVQTIYLNNLLAGEQQGESVFSTSVLENENAHSHAAGI